MNKPILKSEHITSKRALESLPDIDDLNKMMRLIRKYKGSKKIKEAYEDGLGSGFVMALRKRLK